MYLKIFINLILIFLLAIFQFSFISGLPWFFNSFNFVLVIIIFILGFSGIDLALWWAVGVGALLDIFTFTPFGIYIFSLPIALVAAYLLLTNFFTNRSLYSFIAITFFVTSFNLMIFNLFNYFLLFFNLKTRFFILNKVFWVNLLSQTVLNLVLVVIIFYAINFISQRFKPAFLVKDKKNVF